ncbi:MAG: hypothetical protein AAF539_10700, partial [Planctomycetota bacterium]
MNFLCHALPYFDAPTKSVCTGVPDWLSVVDRRIRARRKSAQNVLPSDDPTLDAVARGVLAHLDDDRWFHGSEAFTRLNLQFAIDLRDRLPNDAGFRPTFVGHILVEMLLDAAYLQHDRNWVDQYYGLIRGCDAAGIEAAVNLITGKPSDRIAEVIDRFANLGFLYDYATDAGLWFRVNQVLQRVRLPEIPLSNVADWLPTA